MMEGFMSSDLTPIWPSTPSLPPASPQSSSASTTTNRIDPSKSLSQSQPSVPFFNQETLQQRLRTVIDGARESWTYAIFWQASSVDYAGPSLLGWGDGYYKGEEDKCEPNTASSAEQEHRKKVLLELCSSISGQQAPTDEADDEEVTDTEWFFLVSMTQSFVNGYGLPGQAFVNSSPVWLAGADGLAVSHCERARQAQVFGLQTLVCIPSSFGVVELGSTELIFECSDFMNKVWVLFNFNSIEMESGRFGLGFGIGVGMGMGIGIGIGIVVYADGARRE